MTPSKNKPKPKRHKAIKIILFPIVAIIFTIGWCMTWITSQEKKEKAQIKPQQSTKDNLTIIPVALEESQQIETKK